MNTQSPDSAATLAHLLRWRRDVRHFRTDPVPAETLDALLKSACLAPSVGLSEPWRFCLVETPERRTAIRNEFTRCNQIALSERGEDQDHYARLKLAGLDAAPHHVAVFSEQNPAQGRGLGRATMPDTTLWSTMMAIHTLWLAATAEGIGVGWVSILDPDRVHAILGAPPEWTFVAYLCVGFPTAPSDTPELQRLDWETRNPERARWLRL